MPTRYIWRGGTSRKEVSPGASGGVEREFSIEAVEEERQLGVERNAEDGTVAGR